MIGSLRALRRKESAAHVVPINAAIAPGWIYASWSGRFWYKRTYALSYRKTRSGRIRTVRFWLANAWRPFHALLHTRAHQIADRGRKPHRQRTPEDHARHRAERLGSAGFGTRRP